MKRLTLNCAVLAAVVGVAPAVAGAGVRPALFKPATAKPAVIKPAPFKPALVRVALVKPALVRPALVRPAVVKPALVRAALVKPAPCPDGEWQFCTSPPAEQSGSAKSSSAQVKLVPRAAQDRRGQSGWISGSWYME
jgi:hypothetical protein